MLTVAGPPELSFWWRGSPRAVAREVARVVARRIASRIARRIARGIAASEGPSARMRNASIGCQPNTADRMNGSTVRWVRLKPGQSRRQVGPLC